jgi:signal transduction histidine kinase
MQLLNKTVRSYLVYFIGIIMVSIPLLYVLLNNVIVNETAEITKFQFRPELFNQSYLERLKLSMMTENAVIRTVLETQFFVVATLLAGIFFINRNLSHKVWTPFYHILDQLKRYELNQGTQLDLPETSITEFNLLNGAIIQLTQKSSKVFAMQKEFTDNAAHEMQTPLAIMQGQLELLIQQESLKEDQAEVLEAMIEVCDRLSRLNTSLLLLAKIENEQFIETQSVNIVLLIETLLKQFSDRFKNKGITWTLSSNTPLIIVANKALIEILFSNLLSNAIKYNMPNGKLSITFKDGCVVLSNTGVPYAMDTEKIFERFSKTAGNPQSIGLGLAIVKRICEVCKYKIDYEFAAGKREHVFKVMLASASPGDQYPLK